MTIKKVTENIAGKMGLPPRESHSLSLVHHKRHMHQAEIKLGPNKNKYILIVLIVTRASNIVFLPCNKNNQCLMSL
jgi:hypothetical protein